MANPFPETKHGNIYVLLAINHYSKWCEARAMVDHDVEMAAKFLEHKAIYKFGVLEYILINNGCEWSTKFNQLCKNNGIILVHCTLMEWWNG
jgi:hypothetical protein